MPLDATPAHLPAVSRGHWGFLLGTYNHSLGAARTDSPYLAGTHADRCWLAGWDWAERDAIAESHREKAENDLANGDCN
jgi:hypothetical protein